MIIKDVLELFCTHFEKRYLQLKNNKFELIKADYLARFFRLNNWMDFEINGEIKKMFVQGMSEDGLLSLRDVYERSHSFDVKQVKWLY